MGEVAAGIVFAEVHCGFVSISFDKDFGGDGLAGANGNLLGLNSNFQLWRIEEFDVFEGSQFMGDFLAIDRSHGGDFEFLDFGFWSIGIGMDGSVSHDLAGLNGDRCGDVKAGGWLGDVDLDGAVVMIQAFDFETKLPSGTFGDAVLELIGGEFEVGFGRTCFECVFIVFAVLSTNVGNA